MVIRIKIFIILFFSSTICRGQFFNSFLSKATSVKVSNVKNVQPISTDSIYDAFGFLDSIRDNIFCYFFRRGTTHTVGGNPYYREYNEVANVWYPPVAITPTVSDSLDCRDISGGRMDNDSVVIFYARNHTDAVHTRDIFIQKGSKFNVFSTPVAFNWTGITHLQSGFFYGHMVHGDNPGEYYNALYQLNSDTGTVPHFRVSCIKTTDYWNTYSEVGAIYDGTIQYTETCIAYLGSGKFLALMRDNQSGSLTTSESVDGGVTWTRRQFSNLYWYIGGLAEMGNILVHDGVFDIIYQCRDADMIHISKGNTVASNFGLSVPVYNSPEVYIHHRGTGGNPSLGYPDSRKMSNGKYLNVYARQTNDNHTNLYYTRDDQVTDPGSTPAAPSLSTSAITSTSFRVDITGLTDKQIENIRYWQMDLSTDPAFGSFVTARYRNVGTFTPSVIQNIRMVGLYDIFNTLTTATTYYLRIRACNNVGCSAYTTTNITTL